VFLGRFVALLRILAAFLAGVNRMPWRAFLMANASGGIIWAAVFGIGGYFFGKLLLELHHALAPIVFALALAAFFGCGYLVRRYEARQNQRRSEDHQPMKSFTRGPLDAIVDVFTLRIGNDSSVSSEGRAAVSVARNCTVPIVASQRTARRATVGTASLRSSICLPPSSGISRKKPVKFPSGRARLLTHPRATGSLSRSMPTIGIVLVAFITAWIAYGAAAKITSIEAHKLTSELVDPSERAAVISRLPAACSGRPYVRPRVTPR
jgi:hypothetical protein